MNTAFMNCSHFTGFEKEGQWLCYAYSCRQWLKLMKGSVHFVGIWGFWREPARLCSSHATPVWSM